MQGDNYQLMHALSKGKFENSSEWELGAEDCVQLAGCFSYISFVHTLRAGNHVAHAFARLAQHVSKVECWIDEGVGFMYQIAM